MKNLIFLPLLLLAMTVNAGDLRLMSYNVHNGVGLDKVRDHERLGKVIAAQKVDFVAIQEVDSLTRRSGHTLVLNEIAEAAAMEAVFGRAISFDGGAYGIGLLSREAPDSVRQYPLPGREEQRTMIVADFPGVTVIATHLSLTPEDALESAKIIRGIVAARPGRAVVLMGDLNSLPDSPVIQLLSEDFTSANPDLTPTFPASNPTECIDYIMVHNPSGLKVKSFEVVPEPLASDHRPITAVVEVY